MNSITGAAVVSCLSRCCRSLPFCWGLAAANACDRCTHAAEYHLTCVYSAAILQELTRHIEHDTMGLNQACMSSTLPARTRKQAPA